MINNLFTKALFCFCILASNVNAIYYYFYYLLVLYNILIWNTIICMYRQRRIIFFYIWDSFIGHACILMLGRASRAFNQITFRIHLWTSQTLCTIQTSNYDFHRRATSVTRLSSRDRFSRYRWILFEINVVTCFQKIFRQWELDKAVFS